MDCVLKFAFIHVISEDTHKAVIMENCEQLVTTVLRSI